MSTDGSNQQLFIVTVIGVVLLALAVGLLAGYVLFGRPAAAPAAAAAGGTTAQVLPVENTGPHGPCPFDLQEKDKPLIAGLHCNCPTCQSPLLADCHCAYAHNVKAYARDLLAKEALTHEQLGAALEKRFGQGIVVR